MDRGQSTSYLCSYLLTYLLVYDYYPHTVTVRTYLPTYKCTYLILFTEREKLPKTTRGKIN